jgi:hypothetical protein
MAVFRNISAFPLQILSPEEETIRTAIRWRDQMD